MANSVKKTRRQLIVDIIIVVLITIFVIALIMILNGGKETVTTTTSEKDKNSTIVCKASEHIENEVFKYGEPASFTHEVKVMLVNNKMDKLTYTYTGNYGSAAAAETAHAVLHASYGEYMGKYKQTPSNFSPNFSDSGATASFNLFGEANNVNSYTGKIFFLESSEYNKAKSLSSSMLKKLYENKGFSCDYQE